MFMDRLNVIKMSVQPKRMYKVNAISIKIQTEVCEGLDNLILKFAWESKGPKTARIFVKNKAHVAIMRLCLLDLGLHLHEGHRLLAANDWAQQEY